MRLKRFLLTLLAVLLLPLYVPAQADMRGYDALTGQAYARLGKYPGRSDGGDEPVLWRVLATDGREALLMSDLVLDAQPGNAQGRYDGFESSTLASWLGTEFAQAAFDEAERAMLVHVEGRPDVRLPTADQLKDGSLGFAAPADRKTAGTAYAMSRGVENVGRGEVTYWIEERSQTSSESQRRVILGGGFGYVSARADNVGVRPVIRLDLSRVPGFSGRGSREDPYRFGADGQPLPTPGPTPAPKPRPAWASTGQLSLEGFPTLTPEGFLPEGREEFVFIDAENGLWRYASQDLRINIIRHTDKTIPLRYITAEIFVRSGSETFRMYPHDKDNMLKDMDRYLEKPAKIARNNNLVFTMDGDYFIYRLGQEQRKKINRAIGVEIRGGQLLVDKPAVPNRTFLPPLDMLALFPDGDMRVYKAAELTAQELLELGARDVLSFGPWLIRDGEINRSYTTYGTTYQPRSVIGMVNPGHYWAVVVEGRIGPSKGMTLMEVSSLMQSLGCSTAYNLDGGWTTAMVFMGKQLNQMDKTGVRDNARTQNEVMGIGYTTAFLEGRAP